MTVTLTSASDALKEVYLPRLRFQLNDDCGATAAQLTRTPTNVVSEEVKFSVHVQRGAGTGSRLEDATLPSAGAQVTKKVTTGLKYHYGEVKFTGQVMRLAKADAAAFTDVAGLEMERLGVDLKQVEARQIWNDANGALMVTTGVDTGQVVPFANATPEQWRSLVVGMIVDIGTAGDPVAGADSVSIASWDEVAETVTFVGNVTAVASGHFMRMEDSFSAELTGLRSIVEDQDTLFGLSGVTYRVWNSYVDENGGTPRAITDSLVETLIDEVNIASGMTPDFAVTTHSILRAYAATLTPEKRYNDTTELKGGWTGLTISSGSGTLGLISDRFCPAGELYALNSAHLPWNQAQDWDWMDADGSVLERVPGKDAYHATMYKYSELTTDMRNAHGKITDLIGA
jgi:hypothetical protein